MQLNIGHNKHFTESVSILWVMAMMKSLGNTRLNSPSQVLFELMIKPGIKNCYRFPSNFLGYKSNNLWP